MYTPPIETTVYRGQWGINDGQFQTNSPSLYFSEKHIAEEYAHNPNQRNASVIEPHVIEAKITLHHPFIYTPDDAYLELYQVRAQLGLDEAIRIAVKFSECIYQTNNWETRFAQHRSVKELLKTNPSLLSELYFNAYPFLADSEEVSNLRQLGFDGAVHGGTGASMRSVEYAVFDPTASIEVLSITTL